MRMPCSAQSCLGSIRQTARVGGAAALGGEEIVGAIRDRDRLRENAAILPWAAWAQAGLCAADHAPRSRWSRIGHPVPAWIGGAASPLARVCTFAGFAGADQFR